MAQLSFEDFTPGTKIEFALQKPVTAQEIIEFAKIYDPQPFHLDEAAGRASLLGGLAASGWHTCVMAMRANYDHWISRSTSLGAPGIEEVRWLKPLRPGDILQFSCLVRERRLSRSRPGMGLVTMEYQAKNQNGEDIFYQRYPHMMALRSSSGGGDRPEIEDSTASANGANASGFNALTLQHASKPEDFAEASGYMEDYATGRRIVLGSTRFSRETIIDFAQKYDPQPFHLSEEGAARSLFGKLSASGWQTACCWMGHMVDWMQRHQQWMKSQGLEVVNGGPSPGFTNMLWRKPVFVDDVITYTSQTIGTRTTTRKGWGLVFSENRGFNQNGECVYQHNSSHFAPVRAR